MSRTYVISDLHLGHHMLAEVRGFKDVYEHDATFQEAWFDTVTSSDVVYLLGDIAFNLRALNRLSNWPGRKKLIAGNHDKAGMKKEGLKVYTSIKAYHVVDKGVLMAHMPIHPMSLRPRYRGQIHGHTHEHGSPGPYYVSVCPEIIGYAPILLSTAISQLDKEWLGMV